MSTPIRLNKYLADKKIASRREADELISAGLVMVNGVKGVLGQTVTDADTVVVKNTNKDYIYLAYYKGRGVITHSPEEHETDIVTKIEQDYGLKGITPVGRLDKDSEGLIILSNDGRITKPLLDPEFQHEKEYHVTVDKGVTPMFLKVMELGVDIEGYRTKRAKVASISGNPKTFSITLTEGKKHQIRRMCAALGFQVQSIKRVRIMGIELDKLKPNQYRKIAGSELHDLLKSLGIPA